MKNRRLLSLLSLLVTAVMIVCTFSSCGKKKLTPAEKVENAIQNALGEFIGEDFPALLTSAVEKGSVAFDAKMPTELGMPIESFAIKSYLGKESAVENLSLVMGGETLDASIYAKKDNLAISSNAFLGADVYGIDLANAKANYSKSIFADPNGNFSLVEVFGENGEFFDSLDKYTDVSKNIETLFNTYITLTSDLFEKYTVCTENTVDDVTTITFELNNEGLKNVIKDLYNTAKADTELRTTVSKLTDIEKDFNGLFGETDLDGIVDASAVGIEIDENEVESDEIDIMKEYDEFFQDETLLNEFFAELDKITFTSKTEATIADKKLNTLTSSVNATHTEYEETISAELKFDLSVENKAVATFKMSTPELDEDPDTAKIFSDGIKVIFETAEDTEASYKGTVSVSYGAVTVKVLDIILDKANGTFDINSDALATTVSDSNATLSIKGTYKLNSSEFTYNVTDITVAEQTVKFDVKCTILAEDKAPEYPSDVKDVFSLTEDDITTLAEDIMKKFEDLGL